MVRFYLAVRRDHPRQGKHNGLQRLAYFSMPIVGVAAVLSGLAIWKPVQLAPLTAIFGGFAWARYWHFLAMLLLVVLTLGHVFMVFTVDPYSLRAIITGGYNPARSPEARNARPFVNLRAAHAPASVPEPPASNAGEPQKTAPPPADDAPPEKKP
jgi:cytochrome b subunit of formate dehydrogenase